MSDKPIVVDDFGFENIFAEDDCVVIEYGDDYDEEERREYFKKSYEYEEDEYDEDSPKRRKKYKKRGRKKQTYRLTFEDITEDIGVRKDGLTGYLWKLTSKVMCESFVDGLIQKRKRERALKKKYGPNYYKDPRYHEELAKEAHRGITIYYHNSQDKNLAHEDRVASLYIPTRFIRGLRKLDLTYEEFLYVCITMAQDPFSKIQMVDPLATQRAMGRSDRTIKRLRAKLRKKGYLKTKRGPAGTILHDYDPLMEAVDDLAKQEHKPYEWSFKKGAVRLPIPVLKWFYMSQLKPIDFWVLLEILSHRGRCESFVFPKTIQRYSQASDLRPIRRSISRLIALGYMQWVPKGGRAKRGFWSFEGWIQWVENCCGASIAKLDEPPKNVRAFIDGPKAPALWPTGPILIPAATSLAMAKFRYGKRLDPFVVRELIEQGVVEPKIVGAPEPVKKKKRGRPSNAEILIHTIVEASRRRRAKEGEVPEFFDKYDFPFYTEGRRLRAEGGEPENEKPPPDG